MGKFERSTCILLIFIINCYLIQSEIQHKPLASPKKHSIFLRTSNVDLLKKMTVRDITVKGEAPKKYDVASLVQTVDTNGTIVPLNSSDMGNSTVMDDTVLESLEDKLFFNYKKGLTFLNFANKGITSLKPKSFIDYISLTYLDLSFNMLTRIEPDTFYGLESVTYLDLRSNQIESIFEFSFRGLPSVTYLDLRYNKLVLNAPSLFVGLNSLSYLDLRGNDLQEVKRNVFDGLNSWVHIEFDKKYVNTFFFDSI